MVDEVATVSEQTNEESEAVAAATEEQTATITEVTNEVQEMAAQTDELREVLAKFDVAEGTNRPSGAGATTTVTTADD